MENVYTHYCTPENLRRSTWYGDTYAAQVSVSGTQPLSCDLTYIRIPFDPFRESAAAKRFRLNQQDMKGFYDWLWQRIKNSVKTTQALNMAKVPNVCELLKADTVTEGEIKHIYVATPPYVPYFDTIKGTQIPLDRVCGIGVKIGNLLRDLNNAGWMHGEISINSLYYTEDQKLVAGDFFFAAKQDAAEENPYRYFLPPHVKESVLATGNRTGTDDLWSLCSLLWSLLSEAPVCVRSPYRRQIKKAPEALVLALRQGMEPNADLMDFRRAMSDTMRSVRTDPALQSLSYYVPPFTEEYEPAPERPPEAVTEEDLYAAIEAVSH